MGLIKAAVGAIGGTLADQWKEFFTCDAIDENVLVVKGTKRVSGRSSNTKGEQDVISDGSAIAVADGQCMMVVEQGKVVELSAEPGIFIYKNDLAPSIFAGNLTHDLTGIAKDLWSRFQFGGGTGKDQRVYYFNTKELMGNKYGTATPIPFKVMIDPSINRFLGISVRCNRGVFREDRQPDAVLPERVRQRAEGIHAGGDRKSAEVGAFDGFTAGSCKGFCKGCGLR